MENPQMAKYPIKSLEKALNILSYMASAPSSTGIFTLSDISKALDLNKSNAHRLLDTLVEYNFAERDTSSTYRLGWSAYHVGNAVLKSHQISDLDYSGVEDLCSMIGETVTVSLRNGKYAIILYRALPNTSLRAQREVGYLECLHATAMGKILLCEESPDFVKSLIGNEPLIKFTEHTITGLDDFLKALQEVRVAGFATDMEEAEPDLKCIAMPIRNHSAKIVASISVTMPASRYTPEHIIEIKRVLSDTAVQLSKQLGYAV